MSPYMTPPISDGQDFKEYEADSKYKNALSAYFPADLMEFIFTEYKAKRQLSEVL